MRGGEKGRGMRGGGEEEDREGNGAGRVTVAGRSVAGVGRGVPVVGVFVRGGASQGGCKAGWGGVDTGAAGRTPSAGALGALPSDRVGGAAKLKEVQVSGSGRARRARRWRSRSREGPAGTFSAPFARPPRLARQRRTPAASPPTLLKGRSSDEAKFHLRCTFGARAAACHMRVPGPARKTPTGATRRPESPRGPLTFRLGGRRVHAPSGRR